MNSQLHRQKPFACNATVSAVADYLAAIALQTGRAKDKARLLQFIEAHALDWTKFEALVERHQLLNKWRDFQQQFLNEE